MNILESIVSAFSSVFSNKMRSILTMLGIIIGISSVIMITSIGGGVKQSTTEQFSQMGLDAIVVSVKSGTELKYGDYLTRDDEATLKLSENVTYVSPYYMSSASSKLKNPNETKRASITGTTYEYMYTQPVEMYYGRFIIDIDDKNKSEVAVIDEKFAESIFGTEDAVGQKVTFSFRNASKTVDVIGICKSTYYGPFYDGPATVYMPLSTLMDYNGATTVSGYYLAVKDKDKADTTVNEIARLLEIKHRNKDKYNIQNLMLQADIMGNVMGYLTTFIALVAGISLLVGGIGVMNIMLVTVTERTREIGIRKSLGATNGNIKFQFLIEAMILTLIGGIIGLITGFTGGSVLGGFIDISPVLSPGAVILTVTVSSAIGLIFGVYPASKAAKLDPIDALRYE